MKKIIAFLFVGLVGFAFASSEVTMYKTEYCGCCTKWGEHMEQNGFKITTNVVSNPIPYKEKHKIPLELSSCHTAVVGDYAIEGHVPAADVKEFVESNDKNIVALTVPGMPLGSPGMEQGDVVEDFDVIAIKKDGSTEIFSSYMDGKRYK